MKLTPILLTIAVSGCATMKNPDDNGPYGPKTDDETKGRSGVVVYNPGGLKEIVDIRRKDAFKKIYEFCGRSRDYKIIKEEDVETKVSEGSNSLATIGATRVKEIHFSCH